MHFLDTLNIFSFQIFLPRELDLEIIADPLMDNLMVQNLAVKHGLNF